MAEKGVPLAEGNKAGRWVDGSHTADTVYDRRHGVGTRDPLNAVPLYGGAAHAAVASAYAEAATADRLTPGAR
jgi:NaMN:DMB phosphoribosyltransferase